MRLTSLAAATSSCPFTSLIAPYLHAALQHHKAFAVWRLPDTECIHWIVADAPPQLLKLDLEESSAGFAISPFLNPGQQNTYFIPADWHFTSHEDTPDLRAKLQAWHRQLATDTPAESPPTWGQDWHKYLSTPTPLAEGVGTAQHYQELVARGIRAIRAGQMQKVVLSRPERLPYQSSEPLNEIWARVSQAYPRAFCYLVHLPQIGTWMGASPEILVSVEDERIFRTVALAGTQAHEPTRPLSEAVWTQKEIEEQALVSRYIINCFKKIRLREFEEEGPKTVVAGNLLHLKTYFTVDMQLARFPQLGTVMLDLLHPTSAVCGMPLAESEAFIRANEGYERGFYSGYLGPVQIDRQSHLFVNLRCVQFTRTDMRLYAGAGITEDSDPAREWQETVLKCKTLGQILQK